LDQPSQTVPPKPGPAHPQRRHCHLPWEKPKPESDDPRAPELVSAILESEEYRPADADVEFLRRDQNRGLRLQLDYLKAEQILVEQGIAHSIVVYGSTRLAEPRAAQQAVEELEQQLECSPGDAELERRLRIARNVRGKSHFYDVAREFGRIVGCSEGEKGNRLVLVTGGGPGMMEAANRGAHEVGARTVGLNITLPHEQYPNPYLTPGLCFRFHYFAIRKLHFLKRARALVVFPGGYGTLDELFETLTLVQTRKMLPLPIVLVGKDYWTRVFDAEFLVEEGVIDPEDRELFWYAESAAEIWDDILRWYSQAGRTLFR
jgi:uncharacterized protein (TIGR00730 family)